MKYDVLDINRQLSVGVKPIKTITYIHSTIKT